jgi:hypothetical protein
VKKRIGALLAALALTLAGTAAFASPQAQADNGSCGMYASGWARNSYCGNYSTEWWDVHKVFINATKGTWVYSAGYGSVRIRLGSPATKGNTSRISAESGDTGAYGCEKNDNDAKSSCA